MQRQFLNAKTIEAYRAFCAFFVVVTLTISGFSPIVVTAQEATPDVPVEETQPVTPPPAEEPLPIVIDTGNAVSETTVQNAANTNFVDQTNSPATESSSTEHSEDSADADNHEHHNQPADTFVASTTNNANLDTTASTTAETGDNQASNNAGDVVIDTGIAAASGNIVNTANTNIVNSYGLILLLNSFFGGLGTLDLSSFADIYSAPSTTCQIFCDSNGSTLSTTITNNNDASISNNLTVVSRTGGNTASGNSGNGLVHTGNAYAAGNVVNVANTNITDSNYLMLVLNNFGDWSGDLVLPSGDFFSQFLRGMGGVGGGLTLTNNNNAAVSNTVSTNADTGNNDASGNGGEGVIQTGNAQSNTTVSNQVNQNIFGGASIRLIFRVYGDWLGDVFNTPDGISWQQTANGIEVFNDDENNGGAQENALQSNDTTITNNNTATIENNVNVYALTGENKVTGNGGAGSVISGNAFASANIVNIANSNIVGHNWIYAVINVFGNWRGNVSFGRPDLWIGTRIDGTGTASEPLTYKLTITNNGDADASNVVIHHRFDKSGLIHFKTIGGGEWGEIDVNVGNVLKGKTVEIPLDALVDNNVPAGVEVTSSFNVTSRETDANMQDNKDIISIGLSPRSVVRNRGNNGVYIEYTNEPKLTITKQNNVPFGITVPGLVNYTVTIKNDGGEAYHSVLIDTLKDENGNVIDEQSWNLDTIYPNEEVVVEYTTKFSDRTKPGMYTNYAQVKTVGRNPSIDPFYGVFMESNVASSKINVWPGTPVNDVLPLPQQVPPAPVVEVPVTPVAPSVTNLPPTRIKVLQPREVELNVLQCFAASEIQTRIVEKPRPVPKHDVQAAPTVKKTQTNIFLRGILGSVPTFLDQFRMPISIGQASLKNKVSFR